LGHAKAADEGIPATSRTASHAGKLAKIAVQQMVFSACARDHSDSGHAERSGQCQEVAERAADLLWGLFNKDRGWRLWPGCFLARDRHRRTRDNARRQSHL